MVALLSDDSLPPYILTSNHFGKFNSAIPRESRNFRTCRSGRIGPGDDRRPARSVSPLCGTDMSGNCEYAPNQRAHCRFVWRNESLEGRHSWNRRHDTHYVEDSAQGRRERLVKDDKSTVPDIGDFFYSSPDLLSVFGNDGELIQLNPAWYDMLGWDFDELRGVPFANFVHPDDVQATEDEFRIAIRGPDETRRGFINRQRCRDGTYRTISWSSLRKDGWICATGQDVTDRQEIQDKLNQSTAVAEAMFEAAADSIVIIDRDLNIVESSPESERIYGYPERGRRGRTGLNIVHPDDQPIVEAALRRSEEHTSELQSLRHL